MARNKLNELVLVLNRYFLAIEVMDVRDAICSLVINKAKVVDEDYQKYSLTEWARITKELREDTELRTRYPDIIHSPKLDIFLPYVVIYENCDYVPKTGRSVRFSRKSIYQRDNYTCQYCGKKPKPEDRSLDHVVPRSRGGKSTWKNLVAACIYCNAKKGSKLLSELEWELKQQPKEPRWRSHIGLPFNKIKAKIWEKFL